MNRCITNKAFITFLFLCVNIVGMDSVPNDVKDLVFNYSSLKSKTYLNCTSRYFNTCYKDYIENVNIKNITFDDYIEGLYSVCFDEKIFNSWFQKIDIYQMPFINMKIVSHKNADAFSYVTAKDYREKKQKLLNLKASEISYEIRCIIQKNRKEVLKFYIRFNEAKIANLLIKDYKNEESILNLDDGRYKEFLQSVCSFFGKPTSVKSFQEIIKKIDEKNNEKNKDFIIGPEIIKKALALGKDNFSVLVFLLSRYDYIDYYRLDRGFFFNTTTDAHKRVLIQAGWRPGALLQSLTQAVSEKKIDSIRFLLNIFLDSQLNIHSDTFNKVSVLEYVFEFKLYDLIPKLFEQFEPWRLSTKHQWSSDQLFTFIRECHKYYGEDFWKDERARLFIFDVLIKHKELFKQIMNYLVLEGVDIQFLVDWFLTPNHSYASCVFRTQFLQYVFEFKLYDLIPKLFEQCSSRILISDYKWSWDQLLTFIRECHKCYGEDFWKNERAKAFIFSAVCAVDCDFELLNSMVPSNFFCELDNLGSCCLVSNIINEQYFGKTMSFLLSKGVDIQFLVGEFWKSNDFTLLNNRVEKSSRALINDINNCNNNDEKLYCFKENLLSLLSADNVAILTRYNFDFNLVNVEKIVEFFKKLTKNILTIDYIREQHLSKALSDEVSEKIINVFLEIENDINKEWSVLERVLKRSEINLLGDVPSDKLAEVFSNCSQSSMTLHCKNSNLMADDYKRLLYNVGVSRTIKTMLYVWWKCLSDGAKRLIGVSAGVGLIMMPMAILMAFYIRLYGIN